MKQILIERQHIYFYKKLRASGVICAFSDRTFDLGFNKINPQEIKSNRRELLSALGINYKNLICMKQPHRAGVIRLTAKDKGRGSISFKDALSDCDGMITNQKKLPLAVLTADCLPIFLYDAENPAIGILHAGWSGTYKNITKKAISLMRRDFKTEAENLIVAFGPAIRSCCYEVGREFKKYFPSRLIKKNGRFYLDLIDINKKILIELGVKKKNILDSNICTSCRNKDFFSYRKEGSSAGRMMSVAVLK